MKSIVLALALALCGFASSAQAGCFGQQIVVRQVFIDRNFNGVDDRVEFRSLRFRSGFAVRGFRDVNFNGIDDRLEFRRSGVLSFLFGF